MTRTSTIVAMAGLLMLGSLDARAQGVVMQRNLSLGLAKVIAEATLAACAAGYDQLAATRTPQDEGDLKALYAELVKEAAAGTADLDAVRIRIQRQVIQILASVAMPAFSRYVGKLARQVGRLAELRLHVQILRDGACPTDLGAATLASLGRTAHGPSHSDTTAVIATSTTPRISTGRSRPRGPMPDEASTCISLSRYIRPSPISTPMKLASGIMLVNPSSVRRPSTWNITLAGKLPLATCCSTLANALPATTTSNTATVAATVCASSRRK